MPIDIEANIKVDSSRLRQHPELAMHIGIISSMWNEIEDRLADVFVQAMRTEPAIATTVLRPVTGIRHKLQMIERALALRFSDDVASKFRSIAKHISTRGRDRNRIMHGMWTTHADYPDALIRLEGITDPRLRMEAYYEKDFLESEVRLLHVQKELKEFEVFVAALPPASETEVQERFWRLAPLDPDEETP